MAKSVSAEASTNTRMLTSTNAAVVPSRISSRRRRSRFSSFRLNAAKGAPRAPKSPQNWSHSRSASMAGCHQARAVPPARPQAWTGSSTSRARKFHRWNHCEEERAKVAASSKLTASSTWFSRRRSPWAPKAANSRAYQVNTTAVTPAPVGQANSTQSAASTHQRKTAASRSRSFRSIS